MITDVPKTKLHCASAALLWKNGDFDYWARGSLLRKVLGAGATYRMNKNTVVTNELIYDMKPDGKNKGMFGTNLFWRYGSTHKLGNISQEYRMMGANKQWDLTWKVIFPVDKNTKLTLNAQEEVLSWMGSGDRKAAYDKLKWGLNLEYKV